MIDVIPKIMKFSKITFWICMFTIYIIYLLYMLSINNNNVQAYLKQLQISALPSKSNFSPIPIDFTRVRWVPSLLCLEKYSPTQGKVISHGFYAEMCKRVVATISQTIDCLRGGGVRYRTSPSLIWKKYDANMDF